MRPWPRAEAALLGLLLLATYAYFLPAPAWNESSRFDLVRSLVERQRLDIDPYHLNTEDKAFRNGHFFSDKAPGAAFLAVPGYAAYYAWLRLQGAPLPQAVPESVLRGGPAEDQLAPGERMFLNTSFRRAVYLCNLSTNALAGAALGVVVLPAAGAPGGAASAGAGQHRGAGARLADLRLLDDVLSVTCWQPRPCSARSRSWTPSPRAAHARRGGVWRRRARCWGWRFCASCRRCWERLRSRVFGLPACPLRDARARPRLAGARCRAVRCWLLAAYQLAAFGNPFATGYGHVHSPDLRRRA